MLPYAAERGVALAIEPLHPMFAGDRSVVVTLARPMRMAERIALAAVGVAVDVYHVWWDPDVYAQIARAAGRHPRAFTSATGSCRRPITCSAAA